MTTVRRRNRRETSLGIGVDASGGPVTDPTENVASLVSAAESTQEELRSADLRYIDAQFVAHEKFQNFAREAETRLHIFAHDAESRMQTWMRDAETHRIDQLATIRETSQKTIADMLAESVRTTSKLVADALVQIQNTFNERVSKLEAAQWQSAGRSSVADPALSAELTRVGNAVATLKLDQDLALAKITASVNTITTSDSGLAGQRRGSGDSNARILAVAMGLAAILSPLLVMVFMRGHP